MKKFLLTLMLLVTLGFVVKAETYKYTFSGTTFTTSTKTKELKGSENDEAVSWTLTTTTGYIATEADNGLHLGSSSQTLQDATLSTEFFADYVVQSVKVNFKDPNTSTAKLSVKVGGKVYTSGESTSVVTTADYADYTFVGNESGKVEITAARGSAAKKAFYFKSIEIVYEEKPVELPIECPMPTFSVENNSNVNIGEVVKVNANGADKVTLYVNDEVQDGDSYTVAGNVGDVINLKAVATTSCVDGEKSAENAIKVTIVEKTEITYEFITDGAYGIATTTDYDYGYKCLSTEGQITLSINGTYRMWKESGSNPTTPYTLRLYKNNKTNEKDAWYDKGVGTLTFEAKDGYYIKSIMFGNGQKNAETALKMEGNYPQIATVDASANTVTITTVIVSYDIIPTVVKGISHDGVDIKDGVATFNYSLDVFNHKEDKEYEVHLYLKHSDGTVYHESNDKHSPVVVEEKNEVKARVAANTNHSGTITIENLPEGNYTAAVAYGLKGIDEADLTQEDIVKVTTALSAISAEGAKAEYFDLMGRKVETPAAGSILIERKGAEVRKVIVK